MSKLILPFLCVLLSALAFSRPAAASGPSEDTAREDDEIFQARMNELLVEQLDSLSRISGGPQGSKPGPIGRPEKYVSRIQTAPPPMRVALTFDDGPDAEGTPYILDVLAKYHVRAAFFMKGNEASEHPDLVDRVVRAGHLIVGNHSWSHPDFHKIPAATQALEVKRNQALLGRYQSPMLFRYPFGNATPETNALVHSLGYKIVGWHVDSCDWAYNATGAIDALRAKVCAVLPADQNKFQDHVVHALLARHGGILLMHEDRPNTIRQLDQILGRLVHEGFRFGSLDEPDFQASLY